MAEHSEDFPLCRNCGRRLAWHAVRGAFIHADLGHWWCDPEAQGYDQPRATPIQSGNSEVPDGD